MGIHGDKSQQERDWVLNGKSNENENLFLKTCHSYIIDDSFSFTEFKHGKAPILIATDVASRGLG